MPTPKTKQIKRSKSETSFQKHDAQSSAHFKGPVRGFSSSPPNENRGDNIYKPTPEKFTQTIATVNTPAKSPEKMPEAPKQTTQSYSDALADLREKGIDKGADELGEKNLSTKKGSLLICKAAEIHLMNSF